MNQRYHRASNNPVSVTNDILIMVQLDFIKKKKNNREITLPNRQVVCLNIRGKVN